MAHGGDIYRNRIRLDFSVNINPLGMPESVRRALAKGLGSAEYYPDIKSQELVSRLAEKTGVRPENIVLGNGASELLMAAVHAFSPEKILIPVPSFYGYEYAAKAAEAHVEFYHMREEEGFELTEDFLGCLTADTDMLFLANSNNPTGKYISAKLLQKILDKCEKNDVIVILDECFMELSDEPEINSFLSGSDKTKLVLFKNLMVLRSFTKTFAMPGLRLGYMVCSDTEKAAKIKRHIPEWNISALAQAAGCAALGGTALDENPFDVEAYLKEAGRLIKAERDFLENALAELGFIYIRSRADYILFKTTGGALPEADLYEELLKKRILIRDCSDYRGLSKGWYRIAVRTHEDNLELIKEIKALRPML